jgi:hypothetical protein
MHDMSELMFPSQQQQQQMPKTKEIKPEKKILYDEAALDCIVTDGRTFGDLRRQGMTNFLNVICPG